MTTAMATKRRKRSDRETVAAARAGQLRCDDVLRSATHEDGTVYQQRCIGGVHDGAVKHLPGPWSEIPSEVF